LCGLGAASAASAGVRPPICEQHYARDYAAPLRAMPGAHPPPQGELPFGPRNFGIHRIERTPVALMGSHFGYRFSAKNAGYRVIDLGWRVSATLRSVDRGGRAERILGSRRWSARRVKDLNPLQIAFPATRPGFFRIDLSFTTLSGRRLASFRDYFRVLKRSIDVDITAEPKVVHPGEPVFGLVENRGAAKATVDGFLEVERLEAGGWVGVPQPPNPLLVTGAQWWLESGEASRCYRFDVPADAPAGTYRFSASTRIAKPLQKRTIYGLFNVEDPMTPSPAGS
jgi:hypothetical protein